MIPFTPPSPPPLAVTEYDPHGFTFLSNLMIIAERKKLRSFSKTYMISQKRLWYAHPEKWYLKYQNNKVLKNSINAVEIEHLRSSLLNHEQKDLSGQKLTKTLYSRFSPSNPFTLRKLVFSKNFMWKNVH